MKKVFPDFPKTDLKAWNAEWAKRNAGVEAAVAGGSRRAVGTGGAKTNPDSILSTAAQSAVILDPSSAATAAQGVVDAIASTKPTLKQFLAAHEALKRMDSKAADAALAAGKARWPEADYFKVLATEEAK